ncbi:hypothetical protein K7X08_006821 [Anisodus acutangulus]|uniref:DNA helicase n=1 Tax=Anisodus acutangulus TaxID=402998 RepID=A0A9Q1MW15_9SOLA|nr:hypothetical protein K7X08_006821 [Anisodus acutangulus]
MWGLETGDISLVIGTHSLIAEKVEFSALRIAVVDEQHRFGVIQRGRFNSKGLENGDISLVIGTHSLIAEKVEFSALCIAVVDEQHRFGVIQRGRFNSKLYYNSISSKLSTNISDASSKDSVIMAPHVLAMSATPIPRSLALALYGDMSLTQITDLPPGRIPVETFVIEGNEPGFEKVYQMMLDELEAGGKIYLVYPVIEQSEQLPQLRATSADLETISQKFSGYNCGLLHGKMKGDDKSEALNLFRSGETNILLSTQVIEIGVDIPDASMMVVMNAERFGIAQLHQLRGRVGLGERKSKCILVASTDSSLSQVFTSFFIDNFLKQHLFCEVVLKMKKMVWKPKILGDSLDLEKYPNIKAELSMRQPLCLLEKRSLPLAFKNDEYEVWEAAGEEICDDSRTGAEFHGGAIKALEVLANIVESVADSVYVDCDFDLKAFLKEVDIKHCNIANVFVDDQFIVSASFENKENAELHAAKAALKKLSYESTGKLDIEIEPKTEIGGAKQKLNEICGRKKWPTLDTFIFYKLLYELVC